MPTCASRVAMRSSNACADERTSLTLVKATARAGVNPSFPSPPCAITLLHMSLWDSLRSLVEDGSVALGFIVAAAIVLLLTPVCAWLAPKIGGIDRGGDRPRVHTKPVPRIGGLAIVVGILVPALLFVDLDGPYPGILLGTAGVAAVGLIDDTRGLRPGPKLLAVVALTLVPVLGWHLKMTHLSVPPFGSVDLGWAGYPITILWIAFLANLVNLIDGMDGLAAGIVAIAAGSFALLAVSFFRTDPAALAAIVCGATLAFLPRNYHPAKIFMGDTGALALGYLLAAIAVQGVLKVTHSVIAAIVGVAVLAASAWMVYTLEILKARHLRALGLGRFVRGTG